MADVDFGDTIRVTLDDGSVHEHARRDDGWHVELIVGDARSSIDLAGFASIANVEPAVYHAAPPPAIELDRRGAKPDEIMLDNEARPDRVVVRMR